MWRKFVSQLAIVVLLALSASALLSQDTASSETRLSKVEERLSSLDSVRTDAAGGCGLSMLFGAFCALWAQNTRRSALLWFILGAIFSVITVLVLLYKNSQDRRRGSPPIQSTAPQR
jgi:uncharacterized membrane protein SpoIIM required for sporulation